MAAARPPESTAPDALKGGGAMGELMRATDWGQTPLGTPETWPQSLRTALSILLETRFPMYIAWGSTFVQFYNDGYRPILGASKHPQAMGARAQDTFAESWHIIGPMFEGVRGGTAVGADDWMLPLDRNGYLEECYFTFSYSPIRDESGGVGGVLVTVSETTERVLAERRLATLRNLARTAGTTQRVDDAWRGAAQALESNPYDLPFVLLYSLDEELGSPGGPPDRLERAVRRTLVAATGARDGVVTTAATTSVWARAVGPVGPDGELVEGLRALHPDLPAGPWPERPDAAYLLPIAPARGDESWGILVAGLSSRLALDDDYRGYLRLVAEQISTALASAHAYESETRRAESLAELDRAKTAFFSNVSHEFRTPLTLMLGPIEDGLADLDTPLQPAQRERQELVRRNGLRLQKLVNTLLDFARVEAGRAEAAFVPTDLAAFTTDLASSFRSALASAGLELRVQCAPLPEAIYVDPVMWEKVVLNLVSNALKFTFTGHIRVALEWAGDGAVLTVEDTGTGIPPAELTRVFERFHRVEGARGRSHEGTGIGLALVQELVKLHGGTVEVTSKLGTGSAFTVRIPAGAHRAGASVPPGTPRTLVSTAIGSASFLAEVAQWNGGAARSSATSAAATTLLPAAPLLAAPLPAAALPASGRILIADDNADMRGYLTRLLSVRWEIQSVGDGATALAAARESPPDLILADVMMPGMDGLSLVRELRGDPRTRTVPIVLLSARAGEDATIEGLASGADEYLVKPFSANELLARVNAQVAISHLRQDAIRVEREHARESGVRLDESLRATRSREDTLAMVSHDLRTPLAAIATAAELLELSLGRDELDLRRRKRTAVIRRSAERMKRLLGDLLDSASLEAGTLALELHPHASAVLVAELREMFESQAEESGIALVTRLASVPDVMFDQQRVFQALANLVSNALKFTPRGGTVSVEAARVEGTDEVRFSVTDTGPGVATGMRQNIFERYWHRSRDNRDGHGLGLAIARGLVELHGGRIALECTSDAGSTFSFWLPIAGPTVAAEPALAPVLDRAPDLALDGVPGRAPGHGADHGPAGAYAMPPGADDAFAQGGGVCGALIRAFDWSTTCLGPIGSWPQSLRTSVSTMLRSPYPITLLWGRDLTMLYNDPFIPIYGDKHPDTLGAPASQALTEEWDLLGPLVAHALRSGEPMFIQNAAVFFARLPGGLREEAYFTWSYNPTIGETGGVAGLLAIASETTRQVVGERRLTTLRELSLRTAYDKTVADVFRSVEAILDTAGADLPFALLYVVEQGAARLVACAGVERGSIAAPGAPALDAIDSIWPLARVARSGQDEVVSDLQRIGPLPGGPHAAPSTRALVMPVAVGAGAEINGVLVAGLSPLLALDDEYRSFLQLLARQVSASISSARAYEQETQRAETLAALDRAKTDFFSNVSHEFRTPLTLILGPVEDALARPDRMLSGPALERVRRNALRLYKMVNTLLDFSRIEAGRAQATFVPTDLAAFSGRLASHFQSAVESAGLEYVVECPPLPEMIYVDHEMWEKIVLNLVSNAVKYTHRGRISVGMRWEAETAVLTVEDTGVGIAEREIVHVFDRFYRVQDTQGRSHEGTGIGLALAKELVELHGGTITATSTLGAGSRFVVRMPRGSAHLPTDRVERTARPRSSAVGAAAYVDEAMRWSLEDAPPTTTTPTATAAAPAGHVVSRILVVDDNADLRAYVAGILLPLAVTIETATNGREALEAARAQLPDLILSDVMMPVMDGRELVRQLRADERTRSIPVILLSARAGDEATVDGLSTGADDYLIKPFSAPELVARVRGQLERSRMRAEIFTERAHGAELHRSLALRDEFIAVASHELRTPLTALQIQLESLLRLSTETEPAARRDRVAHKLAVALRQTDRLSRLVESLLDASRLAHGALELVMEPFDLADLAREVVGRSEDDARAVDTSFRLDVAAVEGSWDRTRLDGVLSALISNALKYAPGTVIDVVVTGDADTATVVVRDTGIGIAADQLARLFERFERGVSVEQYGGFGIGLFLCRRIVEAHGGTIAAEATPAAMTAITVTLPRRRPPEPR